MPFTDKALKAEIHAWIKKDGSKVGRISSSIPLALNMHLMEVVWKGVQDMVEKPTIIYVCNTTLQAELLDRQLKDKSFHGGKIGEQSTVSRWGQDLGRVVLLSYVRFRELLDSEAQAPFLPCRLVVICEQEPGSNMDAVVARGQFALIARMALVRKPGCNVKLLGLSYRQDQGRDWLKHAVHLMSTSPLSLSLDQTVSYTSGRKVPEPEQYRYDEEGTEQIAEDVAGFLKNGQNVVVYGSNTILWEFWLLVVEVAGPELNFYARDDFSAGIQRDTELDASTNTLLDLAPVGGVGTLVLIEPGCFATPLPLSNVGMVLSMVSSFPRLVYDNRLHFVTSSQTIQSRKSLQSQLLTGWGHDGVASPGQARIVEVFALDEGVSLPTNDDNHIQGGTHDPLRECLSMVAAYPGTALNLLPISGGVDEPLDLVVRLRVMDLLVNRGNGFILTEKGQRAKSFMEREPSLTLEAATALASINVQRMGEKVARSILRLSFMKDMSESFVRGREMRLDGDGAFVTFLRKFTIDAVHGGPGRERIDRGLIWLIWVAFESACWEVCFNGANLPRLMRPTSSPHSPLCCDIPNLEKAMATLAAWEHLLGLGIIQNCQRENWNSPLTPEEVTIVEHEIARANYSTVLVIPFAVKQSGQREQETLPSYWLRTNEPADIQGEFDTYLHATRRAMTKDVEVPALQEHILFGGLPLSVSTDEAGRTSVTGLMWFTYDVIKALMGNLHAEDADPWVRAVSMQH